MSIAKRCHACATALSEDPGPEVLDARRHGYHLVCWCRLMDTKIQARRLQIGPHRGSCPDPG
jgi:hypothetical protein